MSMKAMQNSCAHKYLVVDYKFDSTKFSISIVPKIPPFHTNQTAQKAKLTEVHHKTAYAQ